MFERPDAVPNCMTDTGRNNVHGMTQSAVELHKVALGLCEALSRIPHRHVARSGVRRSLLTTLRDLLILDIRFASQIRAEETLLWDHVYHRVIKQHRTDIVSFRHANEIEKPVQLRKKYKELWVLLMDSIRFYEDLIWHLICKYFPHEIYQVSRLLRKQHRPELEVTPGCTDIDDRKLVFHLLMQLGDLYRYRQPAQISRSRHSLEQARRFYSEARRWRDVSGLPFNALAVIASDQSRWLHSVYYFIRGACAYEACGTAHGNLGITLRKLSKLRLGTEESSYMTLLQSYARVYVGEPLPTTLQASLAETMRQVRERHMRSHDITLLGVILIGLLFLARASDFDGSSVIVGNFVCFTRDFFSACLAIIDIFPRSSLRVLMDLAVSASSSEQSLTIDADEQARILRELDLSNFVPLGERWAMYSRIAR
ncbi:hypothetical protein PYCC9005_000895 [Savitreella phatthalungensis]